jgi:hypothetical protein
MNPKHKPAEALSMNSEAVPKRPNSTGLGPFAPSSGLAE